MKLLEVGSQYYESLHYQVPLELFALRLFTEPPAVFRLWLLVSSPSTGSREWFHLKPSSVPPVEPPQSQGSLPPLTDARTGLLSFFKPHSLSYLIQYRTVFFSHFLVFLLFLLPGL